MSGRTNTGPGRAAGNAPADLARRVLTRRYRRRPTAAPASCAAEPSASPVARPSVGPVADQVTLHEVGASLAGIASATELISSMDGDFGATSPDAARLLRMVSSEVRRLQRLLDRAARRVEATEREATERVHAVRLEEVVEPLVVRQAAAGTAVRWSGGTEEVLGRADEVAEAVSILLANTARHAPGAPVRVEARPVAGWVALTVSDDGPGVDRRVAGRLFQQGARGQASDGSGIGLHRARLLAEHNGGTLRLLGTGGRGATFELRLPSHRARPPHPTDELDGEMDGEEGWGVRAARPVA